MTLEFEVDVDYLTDGGIKDMPTWVKLNDEDGGHASTTYVNSSSYWHVVDDNAKLRELCKEFYGYARKLFDEFVGEPEADEDFMTLEDRLREMGVEP